MAGVEVASAIAGIISASVAISIHLYGLKNQFETSFRVIDYLVVEWKLIEGYFEELEDFYDTAEFSALQTSRDAERLQIYKVMVEEIGELVKQSDAALNGRSRWNRGKEQIKLMNGTLNEIRDRMRGLQNHILTGHAIFLNRLTTSNTLEQRGAILTQVEGQPRTMKAKLDMRNLQILDKSDRIRMAQARASMEEDDDDAWGEATRSPIVEQKPKRLEEKKNPAFDLADMNCTYPVGMAELPGVTELKSANAYRHSVMGPPPLPLKIPVNSSASTSVGGYPYKPYSPPNRNPTSSLSSPGSQTHNPFEESLPRHRRANSASAYQSPYNYSQPLSSPTGPPQPPTPQHPTSPHPQALQPTWPPQPTHPSSNQRQGAPQRSFSSSSQGSSVLPYPDDKSPFSSTPTVQMPTPSPYMMHPHPNSISRSTSGASHTSRQSRGSSGRADDDEYFF